MRRRKEQNNMEKRPYYILRRLPYPQQQCATICDADGFCVAR